MFMADKLIHLFNQMILCKIADQPAPRLNSILCTLGLICTDQPSNTYNQLPYA